MCRCSHDKVPVRLIRLGDDNHCFNHISYFFHTEAAEMFIFAAAKALVDGGL